jgi:hypothetical protein
MSEIIYTDAESVSALAKTIEEKPEVVVKTVPPSNAEVILPAGLIKEDGSLVKYAEVRELTGLDEEAISKAGSVGRALNVLLERGVVSIGSFPATKSDLEKLLSGDRDALLLGIRRVTFGNTVEFSFDCSFCKTPLDISLDLSNDIPVKEIEDPVNDRVFTYMSETKGPIVVSLPTGLVQKKLVENSDKTTAEINTILLAACIRSVNGEPSMGPATALKLGMSDRDAIVVEIINRSPGPRLGEVTTTCEACGEVLPMPLSLADLFRL